jgi:hypothetical protein
VTHTLAQLLNLPLALAHTPQEGRLVVRGADKLELRFVHRYPANGFDRARVAGERVQALAFCIPKLNGVVVRGYKDSF